MSQWPQEPEPRPCPCWESGPAGKRLPGPGRVTWSLWALFLHLDLEMGPHRVTPGSQSSGHCPSLPPGRAPWPNLAWKSDPPAGLTSGEQLPHPAAHGVQRTPCDPSPVSPQARPRHPPRLDRLPAKVPEAPPAAGSAHQPLNGRHPKPPAAKRGDLKGRRGSGQPIFPGCWTLPLGPSPGRPLEPRRRGSCEVHLQPPGWGGAAQRVSSGLRPCTPRGLLCSAEQHRSLGLVYLRAPGPQTVSEAGWFPCPPAEDRPPHSTFSEAPPPRGPAATPIPSWTDGRPTGRLTMHLQSHASSTPPAVQEQPCHQVCNPARPPLHHKPLPSCPSDQQAQGPQAPTPTPWWP